MRAGSFKRRNNTADIVVFEIEYLERLKPGGAALILDHYVRAIEVPRQAEMVVLKPGSVSTFVLESVAALDCVLPISFRSLTCRMYSDQAILRYSI